MTLTEKAPPQETYGRTWLLLAGFVTAFQKPSSPLPVDFQTTAASGIRTIKLR